MNVIVDVDSNKYVVGVLKFSTIPSRLENKEQKNESIIVDVDSNKYVILFKN